MATQAPRRSGRVTRLRPPSTVLPTRLRTAERSQSPKQSPSRLPLPTTVVPSRFAGRQSTRFETPFTVLNKTHTMSEEADDDAVPPGTTDANLSAVPGVELKDSLDKTFTLEPHQPDVMPVLSATPDVVPAHCEMATDELPDSSPGASLGGSLKFLEASHLWSYDEMVKMGYLSENDKKSIDIDASAGSSLLTESLLNASLPKWQNMKAKPTPDPVSCLPPQPVENPAPDPIHCASPPPVENPAPDPVHCASPPPVDNPAPDPVHCASPPPVDNPAPDPVLCASRPPTKPHDSDVTELNEVDAMESADIDDPRASAISDVTTSVDTGYHGGDSEIVASSIDSVELAKSVAKLENLDISTNSMEGFSQVAKMEAVEEEELADRSVSEADLTMREDDAETIGAPSIVSLNAIASASKKKRTRSPTPSSAKTETVPAKRSLTQQKQMPTASRTANAAANRRSGMNAKSASTLSMTDRTANQRAAASTTRKSSASSGSSLSLPRQSSSGSSMSSRRPSGGPSKTNIAPSGAATTPRTSTASTRPRRSISGSSTSLADAKKDVRDGNSATTPRRPSATASGSLSARAEKSATLPANAGSRLKAPTSLNRTFNKKGASANETASRAGPLKSAGSISSMSNASSPATTPRRRDSQIRPSAVPPSRGPKASSTPFVERSNTTAPVVAATPTTKTRPSAKLDANRNITQVVKVDAEQQTTPSPPHTPIEDLRESLASHIAQANSQNAVLVSQNEQMAAQRQQLTTQAQQLELQASRITQLIDEKDRQAQESRCQLREAVYSFDIMAIVCQNLEEQCCTAQRQVEEAENDCLEAKEDLEKTQITLNTLASEKAAIEEEMLAKDDQYEDDLQELKMNHKATMKSEKQKMKTEMEDALENMVNQHSQEVKTLKRYREKELERLRLHYETMIQDLKRKHTFDLEEISQRDERHLQELQNQHEKKVAEITGRFEEMKVALTERVQSLHAEGNDLRSKANQHQDFIRRNSDVKLQAVIQHYQHLPEENASLKAVLDMRINENAELRRQNTELQERLQSNDDIRDKRDQLLLEIENLQAIISLKSDNEKQLQDKHHQLMRRYDRESKEKKRLSMNYEELLYKLEERQSAEDLTKSSLSDLCSSSFHSMGVNSPLYLRTLQSDRFCRRHSENINDILCGDRQASSRGRLSAQASWSAARPIKEKNDRVKS